METLHLLLKYVLSFTISHMKSPLAFAIRPRGINEVIGQQHLLGEDSFLKKSVEKRLPISMIFFGPPGTGKTTLAKLMRVR